MNDKNNIQTPEETAQTLDLLAERLAKMDKAEGVFGEAMDEELPDEYMDEIAGGFPIPVTVQAIRDQSQEEWGHA